MAWHLSSLNSLKNACQELGTCLSSDDLIMLNFLSSFYISHSSVFLSFFLLALLSINLFHADGLQG